MNDELEARIADAPEHVQEAVAEVRAGGATDQDISDLLYNSETEFVGRLKQPDEGQDLDALSDENNERLADEAAASEAALVDAEASRESVKQQAKAQVAAAQDES